jgi:serine/threonine protein kinase
MRDDSSIVVAGFGFASYVPEGRLKTRCGTPDFVGPEVLMPHCRYDEWCDMWSVGCLLYMDIRPFRIAVSRACTRKLEAPTTSFMKCIGKRIDTGQASDRESTNGGSQFPLYRSRCSRFQSLVAIGQSSPNVIFRASVSLLPRPKLPTHPRLTTKMKTGIEERHRISLKNTFVSRTSRRTRTMYCYEPCGPRWASTTCTKLGSC